MSNQKIIEAMQEEEDKRIMQMLREYRYDDRVKYWSDLLCINLDALLIDKHFPLDEYVIDKYSDRFKIPEVMAKMLGSKND